MAELAWEKPKTSDKSKRGQSNEHLKFLVGGVLILGAIFYLIISGTISGARFFITVDEVVNNPDYVAHTVKVSGAVIGETIDYDSDKSIITFTIANIPTDFEDLATALHDAVIDPDATRMKVIVKDQPMPDLLQHEAQAILTGELGKDGIFYASELLLKCPSRFEESSPKGLDSIPEHE
jgi:cytochrome c-type biogenesis protein CcmE